MPKAVKIILALIGFGFLLVAVFVVDQFIFPFTTKPPYYSDVKAVFNRIQIPSDWEKISYSENRGIRGKRCPIESDGCFSVTGVYRTNKLLTQADVKKMAESTGCVSVSVRQDVQTEGIAPVRYACVINSISINGDYYSDTKELTIYVGSS